MAIYYIIDGTIYQAPDLFLLISNRLLTSLHFVSKAFSLLRRESRFHPSRGYAWRHEEERINAAAVEALAKQQLDRLADEEDNDEQASMMETDETPVVREKIDAGDTHVIKSHQQAYESRVFSSALDGLIHRSLNFASELELPPVLDDKDPSGESVTSPAENGPVSKTDTIAAFGSFSAMEETSSTQLHQLQQQQQQQQQSGKVKRKRKSTTGDGSGAKRRKSSRKSIT